MNKFLLFLFFGIINIFFNNNTLKAQVRLQVRVQSGSCNTQCTDGWLGGAPDPQWRVNIQNDGWTTYPRSGICFQNTPNLQFDKEYLCQSDLPNQIQVCFRAFEDDGASCIVSEDCSVTQCMNFPTPIAGSTTTHTITIPNNGSNRSWGSVTFTISTTGAFSLPGFTNDIICDAIDLGTLPFGASLGNSNLSNYGNFCANNIGDPQPSWNNEQGVWFKFTTSPTPGSVIKIEAKNDPQSRGDQIDLQLALYRSSNNTCTGTLSRIASEHTIPLYSEDMSVNCLLPNTTYYILVDGNNNGILGGQEGFFGLQIYDDGILQAGDFICDAEYLGQVPNGGRIGTPSLSRSNVCATNTNDPNTSVWTSSKSVWFSFRAPASGNVIIEAKSDNPAPFGTDAIDLQLALYATSNNTCNGSLQYIDAGYNIIGFDEDLNVRCLDSGKIYWILVNGSSLNRDGIFDIGVRDGGIPPAPNDNICNAIALGEPIPNGTVRRNNQNNFCADNIFEPIPSNWGNDQGIWYTFIAPPSGKVEIRGRSQGIFGDAIDLQLAVYDSDNMTCSGNLTELISKHSGFGLLWDEDMEVECLTPGRTYFLLVDGEGSILDPDLQEGIFDIIVYGDPRDIASPYDNICDAYYIGNPQSGPVGTSPSTNHGSQNNFCATTQSNEPIPSSFSPRQTVWYSFTAPSTGNVRIRGNSDAEFGGVDPIDLYVAIWESSDNTCNSTFREIQSGSDLLFDFDMEVYCLDAGRIYYIQIDGGGLEILGGREGYFDLQISTLSPIPIAPNNLICDAIDMGNPFTQGTRSITNQHNLCANNIGDPNPSAFSPRQTVWYTFQTPATGTNYAVKIDATSSLPWPFGSRDAIDLQLAVFGSSDNSCNGTLTEIASEYDFGLFDETITVQCLEPSKTYYVMVNGSNLDRQGYFDLSISSSTSVPIAINDHICDHIDLGTVPINSRIQDNIDYYNFCASTENGEPSPFTIDKTVWFSFIAPNYTAPNATANVRVVVESDPNNIGNNIDLQLAVYESNNNTCNGSMRRLDDADPLLSRDAELDLTCLYPGRRYWVQVDGSIFDTDGYFRIRIIDRGSGNRPENNDICNAIVLGQVPSGGRINNNINYHNLCSDIQNGEPRPSAFDIEQTVWFTFQAPASGNATIDVYNDPNNVGNQIDLQLAVYRAAACSGPFIEIDSRYNPFGFSENLSLECLIPGETYYVQVDGASGALNGEEGYFTIQIKDEGGTTNFPYNNDICNAYDFGIPTGTRFSLNNESNDCANIEFSEPGIGNYAENTVWYKFTAPTSARVRIRVKANRTLLGIDPEIYLFESSNNTCSGTFRRINSSNWPTSLITETIEESCLIAGNVYYIQVDGSGIGKEGAFTIDIQDMEPLYATGQPGDPEPINNYCHNATSIPIQSSSCANGTGSFNTYNYGQPTISYNPSYAQNCNNNCGDTWYYFDMPASGIVNVEGLDDNIGGGLLGDFSELTVVAYTGSCNNLIPMQCGRGGFSNDVGFELTATPGTRVYLQVFNDDGDDENENYQLCVSEGCGADHCLTALANPILPNIHYCFNTAGASGENVAGGAAGYYECGENDNPEHSLYYYFVSDCNGSDVTIHIINARSSGSCILGITPTDGFNISFFQDATPCDNRPDALVDCQNFSSCMVQPINWSKTYTNLRPNMPYIIQIDGGFGSLGGNNSGEIMIVTTTNHIATPIVTPPSCDGDDGIATLDINGGVGPFTFQWSTGSTDSILTNLEPGLYFATITGANGCVETTSVELPAIGGNLVANIDNIKNPTCNNACDGQATVVGSTGRPPYTYTWNNGQTNATAIGLCAGTYQVTINDNNSCFQITTVTLSNPVPMTLVVNDITNASCINCDGGATVIATGGIITIDYSYQWSNGNGFSTATNLCSGIHTVTVTDNSGCSLIETITITQPTAITTTLLSQTNIACYGDNTGRLEVIGVDGIAPYTYSIDTNSIVQNNGIFTNLSAGIYNITVTDANSCRSFVPVTITEPNMLTTTLVSSINPSCNAGNDGEITVLADNFTGTAPYTYTIDGSNYQSSGSFTNLTTGHYIITTKDANNCTTTTDVTLQDPSPLMITNINQTTSACGLCNAHADILVTGGSASYSFVWSNGETTQNAISLCAGTAQVTVTDNLGCTQINTLIIDNDANFSASTHISGAISCINTCNGQISLTITNGVPPFNYLWSNGQTTATATGLCIGLHSVTITDANNCSTSTFAELIAPNSLTSQMSITSPSLCHNATDAVINITVIGGSLPYSYNWDNGYTASNTTTVNSGIHYVTVTDNNGCNITDSIIVTSPAPISIITDNIVMAGCEITNCTGSATAHATGGTIPYIYAWDNGENTAIATALCANIHTVTITDANNCHSTLDIIIPANTSLNINNIVVNNVLCNAGNTGSANINVNGGLSPYLYSWSNGNSTNNIENLTAGIYSLTVTDANACSDYTIITITEPQTLSLNLNSPYNYNNFDISCFGATDGGIVSDVQGGIPPYSYIWSNNATTNNLNDLGEGIFALTVTDANGCTISQNITLRQPNPLVNTLAIISNYNGLAVSCFGANDASVLSSIQNAISPFQYNWSNGETTAIATALSSGLQSVTVTDANNCSIISNINIDITPELIISNINSANASCYNSNNGSLTVNTIGGTPNYQYNWSNGENSVNANNLGSGIYTVTVTDINGCFAVANGTITAPSSLTSTFSINNPVCFGDNTGSATINIAGGIPPYSYTWFDGTNTATHGQLSAGIYNVIVTDFNGCIHSNHVTITEPSILSAQITNIQNTLCATGTNGSMEVIAQGGSIPYSYTWSNGATSSQITGLSPNTYSVTVSDIYGCTVVLNNDIVYPNLTSEIRVNQFINCFGGNEGEISLMVNGGSEPYSYIWNNGSTNHTLSNLSTGTYSVTITDINACTITNQIILTEPQAFTATANITSNYNGESISCNGAADGQATVYPLGGTSPYTYQWLIGQSTQTVTGLTRGTYNVEITDANGCITSSQITINDPAPIELGILLNNISCYGADDGNIIAEPNNGIAPYSYTWSNGATNSSINNLAPNTYQLTVSDANACTVSWLGTIIEPFSLVIGNVITQEQSCLQNRDAIIAIDELAGGTAPYHVEWSNNNIGVLNNNLIAGTYTVTITDLHGCSLIRDYSVGIGPAMTIDFSNVSNILCNDQPNGSATVVITQMGVAPYTYQWDNGFRDSIAVFLHQGMNYVTVTDSRGCRTISGVNIINPNPLTVNIMSTNITCNGLNDGIANTNVTGGITPYQYNWSNGATTANITDLQPNNMYILTVTDANNCSVLEHLYLYEPSAIIGNFDTIIQVNCFGNNNGRIRSTAIGGTTPYNFSWSSGRTTSHHGTHSINNLTAGIYSVTITDAKGCYIVMDTVITQPDKLTAISTYLPTTCHSINDGLIQVFAQGGTSPYQYSINNGRYSEQNIFNDLAVGNYTVHIMDTNNCTYTLPQIRITAPDSVVLEVSSPTTIRMGETTDMWVRMPINAPNNPRVQWLPSTGVNCNTCYHTVAQPFETTNYIVSITGDDNCPSHAEILITVEGKIDIYLPNAFTPNGDGINDIFMFYGRDGMAIIEEMMIFDRWGELVFSVKNAPINFPGYGWDGTFKNKPLNSGVFAYMAKVRYINGMTETFKGDVTLLR